MYNEHSYFSPIIWAKKCALYMVKYSNKGVKGLSYYKKGKRNMR